MNYPLAAMGTRSNHSWRKNESIAKRRKPTGRVLPGNERQKKFKYCGKEMELLENFEGRRAELPSDIKQLNEIKMDLEQKKQDLSEDLKRRQIGGKFEKLRTNPAKAN
ncbi:MAG: hypothetical protein R2824_05565 [Saprospiraceae bacterium]